MSKNRNCLLPPWHIPCESRVHLPLASLWPQGLGTAGCVVPQLECQAAQQLSPMAGELERLFWAPWGGNLQSGSKQQLLCKVYLQNMQNLPFLESNSCSVTKLSSGKAAAGYQMHQDTCYGTMNKMLVPQRSWILAAICNCTVLWQPG